MSVLALVLALTMWQLGHMLLIEWNLRTTNLSLCHEMNISLIGDALSTWVSKWKKKIVEHISRQVSKDMKYKWGINLCPCNLIRYEGIYYCSNFLKIIPRHLIIFAIILIAVISPIIYFEWLLFLYIKEIDFWYSSEQILESFPLFLVIPIRLNSMIIFLVKSSGT